MLQLHHIFVCSAIGAPEAQALLDAGLVEGSSNIHRGQGTANRRFFCTRGMLELLWVNNEAEARSELAGPTQLWERWSQRGETSHPFGLCFSWKDETADKLPFASWDYRPPYLPAGRYILFADGLPLTEPEVFVLGWPQDTRSPATEPTGHPIGLGELQSVSVGVRDPAAISNALQGIKDAGLVDIHASETPELKLLFTADSIVELHLPELGLHLFGQPEA